MISVLRNTIENKQYLPLRNEIREFLEIAWADSNFSYVGFKFFLRHKLSEYVSQSSFDVQQWVLESNLQKKTFFRIFSNKNELFGIFSTHTRGEFDLKSINEKKIQKNSKLRVLF